MSDKPKRKRHCRWTLDKWHEYYATGCKQAWSFLDGGTPDGHGVEYCPFCGKPIKVMGKAGE